MDTFLINLPKIAKRHKQIIKLVKEKEKNIINASLISFLHIGVLLNFSILSLSLIPSL
jgi:hypothetical protein